VTVCRSRSTSTIDWGDGSTERVTSAGVVSHSYDLTALSGTVVDVVVTGTFVHWGSTLSNSVDQSKLTRVNFIGFGMGLRSLWMGFTTATNLEYIPESLPDTVTELGLCFSTTRPSTCHRSATGTSHASAAWQTCFTAAMPLTSHSAAGVHRSAVISATCSPAARFSTKILAAGRRGAATTMEGMLADARSFNNGGSPSINDWNVTNLLNATGLFSGAWAFNQPIGNWVTTRLTTMTSPNWPWSIFYVRPQLQPKHRQLGCLACHYL